MTLLAMGAGSWWLTTVSVIAMEIDFEQAEGYQPSLSPVGLSHQDYMWYGKAGFGEITASDGVEEGQSLRLPPIGDFASLDIRPTSPELPDQMYFTVMVKLETLQGGSFRVPLRLRLGLDGEAEAFRIHFYEGGKVEFFSNGNIVRAQKESEGEFIIREGVYTRVEVWLDFKTNTYKLTLDNVIQKVEGSEQIAFMNTHPRTTQGKLEITNSHPTVGGAHLDRLKWVRHE